MRRLAPLLGLCLFTGCASTLQGGVDPGTAARFYAFASSGARPPIAPAPPLRLTASDGAGLRLASLEARAVLQEPLAFTELHLAFDNPDDRRLEGTFTITLPEGAALSRFAMKIGDAWQEAEVVEKARARTTYEDFLHARQDPALLEQAPGNQFSARVFPIPARGRKEIIVAYSQELAGRAFTLPLLGLPRVGRLAYSVTRAGDAQPIAEADEKDVIPQADVQVDARSLRGGAGLRSGELVVARVRPIPAVEPDPLEATILLVDTSASRALGFEDQVRLVARLARSIAEKSGARTPIAVAAFDQTTEAMFEGDAGAFGDTDARRLREREAFGASNLGAALTWAEARAKAKGYKRVVLVGDGVATAGEVDASSLASRAARLKAAGVERIDAVVLGGIRDEAALRSVARAGLARDGVVVDGGLAPDVLERRLTQKTRSNVPVSIEGALWQWPTTLDGVQAGDEVLVYAEVPEGLPVRLAVGGMGSSSLDLAAAPRPLLERALAKAKIASLLDQKDDLGPKGGALREVIALSTKHRVVTPYTSMLVLESDADYARFNIHRDALAPVLTVENGRIATSSRGALPAAPVVVADGSVRATPNRAPLLHQPELAPPPAAPPPPPAPAHRPEPRPSTGPVGADPLAARGSMWGSDVGEAYGSGGLHLTGVGEGGGGRAEGIGLGRVGAIGHGAGGGEGQGFGAGHGRLGGSHRVSVPDVRSGTATVSGRLPPEVIQRIVRQQMGKMRLCYEAGLRRDPHMGGRIALRFVIARDGGVATVEVQPRGELPADVSSCVARTFGSLVFPAPEGGMVTVVYPLAFAPSGEATPPPALRNGAPPPPAEPPPVAPPPAAPPPDDPPPETPVAQGRSKNARVEPYSGRFKSVMDLLGTGGVKLAIDAAYAWHREAPGDVMALVALGEALERATEKATAARVYGSIVDLYPARADLRRFAGERLERLGDVGAAEALDTFAKAEHDRPDHPESHRLLAFARLRRGDYDGAFAAAARGAEQKYPEGRFRGVGQILREDLGLIAAAWTKAEPARKDEIRQKLDAAGGIPEEAPSLRFVLSWETDANDVDFHIKDAEGGHAYYEHPELESGGQLYADVTTGYGPECFTIRLPKAKRSERYELAAHYYARGPMGYGMGKIEVIDHDGTGGLTFDERPFVVMADGAYVDLGTWTK